MRKTKWQQVQLAGLDIAWTTGLALINPECLDPCIPLATVRLLGPSSTSKETIAMSWCRHGANHQIFWNSQMPTRPLGFISSSDEIVATSWGRHGANDFVLPVKKSICMITLLHQCLGSWLECKLPLDVLSDLFTTPWAELMCLHPCTLTLTMNIC